VKYRRPEWQVVGIEGNPGHAQKAINRTTHRFSTSKGITPITEKPFDPLNLLNKEGNSTNLSLLPSFSYGLSHFSISFLLSLSVDRFGNVTDTNKAIQLVDYYLDPSEECEIFEDFLHKTTGGRLQPPSPLTFLALHACGDLTPIVMRHFVKSSLTRALVVVGCCYQALRETVDHSPSDDHLPPQHRARIEQLQLKKQQEEEVKKKKKKEEEEEGTGKGQGEIMEEKEEEEEALGCRFFREFPLSKSLKRVIQEGETECDKKGRKVAYKTTVKMPVIGRGGLRSATQAASQWRDLSKVDLDHSVTTLLFRGILETVLDRRRPLDPNRHVFAVPYIRRPNFVSIDAYIQALTKLGLNTSSSPTPSQRPGFVLPACSSSFSFSSSSTTTPPTETSAVNNTRKEETESGCTEDESRDGDGDGEGDISGSGVCRIAVKSANLVAEYREVKELVLLKDFETIGEEMRQLHKAAIDNETPRKIKIFNSLQVCVGNVMESLLLLDRYAFLREHQQQQQQQREGQQGDLRVSVLPIFRSGLSPRNLAIVALKTPPSSPPSTSEEKESV
jgi:hypothetical protein